MRPVEGGRFCGSCQQTVVDFTTMTDAEVIQAMSRQKGRVCGRFRAEQLNRPLRSYSSVPYAQRRLSGLLTAGLLGWQTTQAGVNAQGISRNGITVQSVEPENDQSLSNPSGSVMPVDTSRVIRG